MAQEQMARLEASQAFAMHIGHRDQEQAMALLSSDVSYRIAGDNSMTGSFSGSEQVAAHLCELSLTTEGTYQAIKWEDWMVGEQHVAAWADVQAERPGRRFTGRVLFLIRFDAADKIDEIIVLPEDPIATQRFFRADPPQS